jgi:predicted ArsR family transcriptional regulator
MTGERDLFDPGSHARGSDPSTSQAAAQSMVEEAPLHSMKILATLDFIGEGTFDEIADAADMTPAQVWRRLSDLEKAGLAEPTEKKRRGKSRRYQRVWRRTP